MANAGVTLVGGKSALFDRCHHRLDNFILDGERINFNGEDRATRHAKVCVSFAINAAGLDSHIGEANACYAISAFRTYTERHQDSSLLWNREQSWQATAEIRNHFFQCGGHA